MVNEIYNLGTREEMIELIKDWYDFQLKNHKIPLNYYRLFMKNLPNLSSPSIQAFYRMSLGKLKEKRVL